MEWYSALILRKPELAAADADVVCRCCAPHHAPSLQARLLLRAATTTNWQESNCSGCGYSAAAHWHVTVSVNRRVPINQTPTLQPVEPAYDCGARNAHIGSNLGDRKRRRCRQSQRIVRYRKFLGACQSARELERKLCAQFASCRSLGGRAQISVALS
jgi:hypothetical protein